MRAMGVARRLGRIDDELVRRLREGASLTEGQASHSYIEEVSHYWKRAGFDITEKGKDTPYTRSLRQNISIANLSDENGQLLPHYQNTPLAEAINEWLGIIQQFADDLTLSRINVMAAQGFALEHIDPPDQNMIQCLLAGETAFEIHAKSLHHAYKMELGEIWWFNTTWPHSTKNDSHTQRLLLHTRGNLKEQVLRQIPEATPHEVLSY